MSSWFIAGWAAPHEQMSWEMVRASFVDTQRPSSPGVLISVPSATLRSAASPIVTQRDECLSDAAQAVAHHTRHDAQLTHGGILGVPAAGAPACGAADSAERHAASLELDQDGDLVSLAERPSACRVIHQGGRLVGSSSAAGNKVVALRQCSISGTSLQAAGASPSKRKRWPSRHVAADGAYAP